MRWFERWRARKKMRAAVSQYLASEVIDELVSRPAGYRRPPEATKLCFILLQVRDDPVDHVPAHLAKAFDLSAAKARFGASSPPSIVTFGMPFSDDPDKDRGRRAKSVARLVTELGGDVCLVYGTVNGLLGSYGSERRFVYGPLLPGFPRYSAR